jgi:hypothetical protein
MAQMLPHEARHFTDPLEIRADHRIQIEVQEIGPVIVIAAGIPGVQIDTTQIDQPEQAGEVLGQRKLDHVAAPVNDRTDLGPVRTRPRGALHVEEIALRAVRISLHDDGAIGEMGQEPRRDVSVIAQQIALAEAQPAPKGLAQVCQLHRP